MSNKYKKAIPAVLVGAAVLNSIPIKVLGEDSQRLYGKPDSLLDVMPNDAGLELTKIKIDMSGKDSCNKKIGDHISRMLNDEDYAKSYHYIKDDIYRDLGITLHEVNDDPNVKILEVIAIPEFRRATREQNYDLLIQILIDQGLIGSDDFTDTINRYRMIIESDKDKFRKLLFDEKLTANVRPEIEPLCVTCISFAGVAVNVAAATNVVVAVIAVVYAGVWAWGPAECIDSYSTESRPTSIKSFGNIALMDRNISNKKIPALETSEIFGLDKISEAVFRDIAKIELTSFFTAAYELGLIDNKDSLNLIIDKSFKEIDLLSME